MDLTYILTRTSFALVNFKNFYYEVLREKERALRTSATQNEHATPETSAQELCDSIQRHLYEVLESQSLDAARQIGEFSVTLHEESQYIMVALADEIFLSFEWIGRRHWENHLLEVKVFHTQMGGELFFQRLATLIKVHDPTHVDLAVMYLYALGLGFRGRYGEDAFNDDINNYRHQLLAFITHQSTSLFREGRPYLMDDPYQHNIVNDHRRFLPEVRLWLMSFAGIAILYLFVSYVLWYEAVHDVNSAIGRITEQAKLTP
jgi:type VI secretion system protein ImpK